MIEITTSTTQNHLRQASKLACKELEDNDQPTEHELWEQQVDLTFGELLIALETDDDTVKAIAAFWTHHTLRKTVLAALATEPSSRNKGIGRRLVQAVEASVAAAGVSNEINVTSSPDAVEFYKKLGFTAVNDYSLRKEVR